MQWEKCSRGDECRPQMSSSTAHQLPREQNKRKQTVEQKCSFGIKNQQENYDKPTIHIHNLPRSINALSSRIASCETIPIFWDCPKRNARHPKSSAPLVLWAFYLVDSILLVSVQEKIKTKKGGTFEDTASREPWREEKRQIGQQRRAMEGGWQYPSTGDKLKKILSFSILPFKFERRLVRSAGKHTKFCFVKFRISRGDKENCHAKSKFGSFRI